MEPLDRIANKIKDQSKEEISEIVERFFKDIEDLKERYKDQHEYTYHIDVGNGEVPLRYDQLRDVLIYTLIKAHTNQMRTIKEDELLTMLKLI